MGIAQSGYSIETEMTPVLEKKSFDNNTYNELKKEVELVEEIAKKQLEGDSSEFGTGYGVEYGRDYIVYRYDSITGETMVIDSNRRTGREFADEGIRQPEMKDSYIRHRRKKQENTGENVERGKRTEGETNRHNRNKHDERNPRTEGDGSVSRFVLIVLIALGLGLIVYFLFVNKPVQSNSTKISFDEEIDPTRIELSEIELKIIEAEKENENRIAIRLLFIWVMKELSEKELVEWKKKKTNYHYLSELSGTPLYVEFERIVSVFEYVWYGKYDISNRDYKKVKKEFLGLIENIKNS